MDLLSSTARSGVLAFAIALGSSSAHAQEPASPEVVAAGEGSPAPAPTRPDQDGDGYFDDIDECPDAKEIKNGFQDDDGCPDAVPIAPAPTIAPTRPIWRADPGEPPMERASEQMMIFGILSFGVGMAIAAPGVLGLVWGGGCEDTGRCEQRETAAVIIATGGTFVALGLPLWLIGRREVPVVATQAQAVVPRVLAGPGGGALRWTF